MVARFLILGSLLAGLLTGCGVSDDRYGDPSDGYKDGPAAVTAAVDWSKAEKLSVTLSEFDFEPAEATLRVGRPYALTLTNDGLVGHTFVGGDFFRAIAAKGLLYADGESSFPVLEAIYLESKENKTLLFLPLDSGDFTIICDRPLHEKFGMTARFRIE